MADGACGVQSGGRAYSSSADSSLDEAARERIAISSEEKRRRADAEAEARTASFIAGGTCGGGSAAPLQTVVPPSLPKAVGSEEAADQKRIDAIVRPGHKDTFDGLTGEIVRLKRLTLPPNNPALRAAVTARIGQLTQQWTVKAQAEGVTPPTAGFDPYTATDRALRNAFLWTEVGGAVPLQAVMTDGGTRFREDIFEAVALRTPGLDTMLLASYRDQPGAERALLERELLRLGDHSPCRADEKIESLRDRRAALLRVVDEKQAAIDGKIRWIGLDGRQGTFEQLVDYELEQRWLAMNPGTTTGAITATASTLLGGTTEEIRAAGQAGNAWQNVAGAIGGVGDPRTLGPKPAGPQISGRRREMPHGPGLGRRSSAGRAGFARAAAAGTAPVARQPTSLADKHMLNGEVTSSRGVPRATGFHHQAPGTEANARIVPGTQTPPNARGVYRGTVEVKDPATGQWVRKDADSTFFPKTWTRSEVRTAILEAFANRTDRGGGVWTGRLSNGMVVTGYVDRAGRVTSAYPEMEE
jgi:Bacterial EndoU nuclease